jgi:catechol 2,3-dioxygenase-like lactoylglutathione lyase family enzyme
MQPLLKGLGAITMFVEDPARSKAFYRSVLGSDPVYEDDQSVAFDFGGTIVNLLTSPEARTLIAPAIVADREAGSRFQLTVWVDDTDSVVAQLAIRGVTLLNGPMDRPWGMRTAAFTDPDGHIWEVAQEIAKGG